MAALIREADTVVFVLSPSSAKSEVCAWEVELALSHGKRILPVVCRPLTDATPPHGLRRLNYIIFHQDPKFPDAGFGYGLAQLAEALNTDLDWMREHTRLLSRANEWMLANKAETRLLIGSDVAAAKSWIARCPKGASGPTDLQLEFIKASEIAELNRTNKERQQLDQVRRYQHRFSIVLLLLSLFTAAAAVLSFLFYRDASLRESSAFAILSDQYLQSGLPDRAMRFALAGLPKSLHSIFQPWSTDAEQALLAAYAANRVRLVLPGHTASVTDVSFNRDGSKVLSASNDKTARIWDVTDGKQLQMLGGHSDGLHYAIYSPDGTKVVTVSDDATRIWNTDTWTLIGTTAVRVGTEMRPTFMRDGRRLIVQLGWQDVAIIDTDTGALERTFKGHTNYLESAYVSSDGLYLLTAAADKTARLWDVKAGLLVQTFSGHSDNVTRAVLSADGKIAVTASLDGTIRRWDVASGRELRSYKYRNDRFTNLLLAKTGAFFVSASYEGRAMLWRFDEEQPLFTFQHADAIINLEFNSDEKLLLTAGWDGRARSGMLELANK